MQGHPATAGENGLRELAQAISRSTALHVAMSITPAEGDVEEMLKNADRLARWVSPERPTEEAWHH